MTENFFQPSSTLQTVFLDRDGVLNKKMPEGCYVTSWGEFEILPGVAEAIRMLNHAGLRVLVVSNQRGIALGRVSLEAVRSIHSRFAGALATEGAHIDAFYLCPHDKRVCRCRKPLPGLFEQACRDYPEISVETSIMIGDSLSDIQFGRNLGMKTVFIAGNPRFRKPGASEASNLAGATADNLLDAVRSFLY